MAIYGRRLSRQPPSAPNTWRKGLLLGESHIGDVLYNTASLSALKTGVPHCDWYYLAERPACEVLENNPNLAGVLPFRRPRGKKDGELFRHLRAERFDAAICYNSGQYWRDLLLAATLGIPNRVGYTHKGFSGLVTYPISINYPQPYPAYFRSLVVQLTGNDILQNLRPSVFPTAGDEKSASDLWHNLQLSSNTPTLACFMTTRQPTGIWPDSYYGEALSTLRRENVQIVLCGAAEDHDKLAYLREQYHLSCPIVAGRLGLRALVVFLKCCNAVLSTDSGPRHLANAAGVPVAFFRNLRSSRIETGVYCETEKDLCPDNDCVPPEQQDTHLRAIKPEYVAGVLSKIIAVK